MAVVLIVSRRSLRDLYTPTSMQLTHFTDYSLRVLMYLAVRPGRVGRIEEIAETYDISRGHVMKVVRRLGAFGFVTTIRGRGGGLRLARAAAEIGIGEVVRQTEENLALVECFRSEGSCVIDPACGLQGAFEEALEAFLASLDRYTLEDLIRQPRKMAKLLEIA